MKSTKLLTDPVPKLLTDPVPDTAGVDCETGQVVGRVMEAVDLGTFPVGQGPYNYSDMSGFVTLAVTQPAGVWDYVKDGGDDYTRWSLLTLDAEFYSGDVIVEVRAADRVTDLPAWPFRRLSNVCGRGGFSLDRLGVKGRHLEVRVTLLRTFGATQGPVLKSLCLIRDTPGTDLQITQHPKSVIVDRADPSDPAVFAVAATGTQPPLSYQWFKDGSPVGTGSTFTVNNPQYANAGKYKVLVTDASGAFLDSAEARLHVVSTPNDRPRLSDIPNPRPVAGTSVALAATMDVYPSLGLVVHYQWRRDGKPIANATGTCATSDGRNYTSTYSMSSVTCEHTGEYSVVFTNLYWKAASWREEAKRLDVTDSVGNDLPLVTVTPASPVYIANRNNPPTLSASTTCFTAVCAKWYRINQSAGTKEVVGEGFQYTLPNPVPCSLLQGDYILVEVYDEGRIPHSSAHVTFGGDCEP